jgi:PIN domain nuclease of toxin-antitoxin system
LSFAYLDTHVAVYLYDGLLEKLSKPGKREIEASDLLISPVVLLELEYLYIRKRVSVKPRDIYHHLHVDFGVRTCGLPFAKVIDESLDIGWTSDPFDRMIVAQAKANRDSPLITKDERILENYPRAVW